MSVKFFGLNRKFFLRIGGLFLLLIGLYLLLGLVSYAVSEHDVKRHVQRSIENGELREDYPKAIIVEPPYWQNQYTLDNFTDALIVNQVLHFKSEGLQGILLLPRHDFGGAQCDCLSQSLSESDAPHTVIHYARYWHGTTFLARILFAYIDYSAMRYFIFFVTSVMLLWCAMRLRATAGIGTMLSVVVALLSVDVFVMQFSLQFAPALLIALGAIIYMTYRKDMEASSWLMLFMVAGSLTAFLDLITVPTLTLGLPLVAMVALRREDRVGKGLAMVLMVAFFWLGGYVATWLAKWGIATVLTSENIFVDAYNEATHWTNDGQSYLGKVIPENLQWLHTGYILSALIAMVVLAVVWRRENIPWAKVSALLLTALIPFVYYLFMPRPAAAHSWFNYRALATSVAALLLVVFSFVDWRKVCQLIRHWIVNGPQT